MRHEFRNLMLCPYSRGTTCKLDMFDAAASNVNASIGAFSSLGTDLFNYFSNKETNEMNKAIAEKNNETSINIARENNELQRYMNEYNNQFAAREAEKAWARQIQWNNPVNQMRMLKEAGLNPSVYFASHGSAVGSAASPAASPHGSGISPSMPTLTTPQLRPFFMSNPAEGFKAMASALASLGEAKKLGIETDTLKKSQDDILRKLKAETDLVEISAILEKRFGEKKRSKELQQMDVNIAKGVEETYNLAKEGKFTEAQTRLTELKQETEKATSKLRGEEAEKARKENEYTYQLIQAKLDNLRSSTRYNNASASASTANARLTNERASQLEEMHEDNVKMNQWLTKKAEQDYKITDMDREAIERSLERKISYLNAHYGNMKGIEKKQYELAVEALKTAKLNNDYYHYKMALETISSCLGLAISAERAQQRGYTRERVVDKDGSFYEEYTPWNE